MWSKEFNKMFEWSDFDMILTHFIFVLETSKLWQIVFVNSKVYTPVLYFMRCTFCWVSLSIYISRKHFLFYLLNYIHFNLVMKRYETFKMNLVKETRWNADLKWYIFRKTCVNIFIFWKEMHTTLYFKNLIYPC
jgi:hypothetical protein